MDNRESRTLILVCFMVCITLTVSVFFMTGCEERSYRDRVELSAQRTKQYEEDGYIRQYNRWSGYVWVKPENKEADNAKNQD